MLNNLKIKLNFSWNYYQIDLFSYYYFPQLHIIDLDRYIQHIL